MVPGKQQSTDDRGREKPAMSVHEPVVNEQRLFSNNILILKNIYIYPRIIIIIFPYYGTRPSCVGGLHVWYSRSTIPDIFFFFFSPPKKRQCGKIVSITDRNLPEKKKTALMIIIVDVDLNASSWGKTYLIYIYMMGDKFSPMVNVNNKNKNDV